MSLSATTRFQMDQSSKKANRPNLNDIGFFSTSKRHCAWEAKGIAPTKGLLYTKLFDGLLLPITVNNTEFIATQAPDRSGHTFICCSMDARIKITTPGSSQNYLIHLIFPFLSMDFPMFFFSPWISPWFLFHDFPSDLSHIPIRMIGFLGFFHGCLHYFVPFSIRISVGLWSSLSVYVPLINSDVKLDLQNVTKVNLGWVQTNPN